MMCCFLFFNLLNSSRPTCVSLAAAAAVAAGEVSTRGQRHAQRMDGVAVQEPRS